MRVEFRYLQERKLWIIQEEVSEVIEFSGCGYSESTISEGRFYFKTDMLVGADIWPKRPEFVTWADRVFGLVKRELQYSPDRQVYVSPAAARWQRDGGRLEQFLRGYFKAPVAPL